MHGEPGIEPRMGRRVRNMRSLVKLSTAHVDQKSPTFLRGASLVVAFGLLGCSSESPGCPRTTRTVVLPTQSAVQFGGSPPGAKVVIISLAAECLRLDIPAVEANGVTTGPQTKYSFALTAQVHYSVSDRKLFEQYGIDFYAMVIFEAFSESGLCSALLQREST